MEIRSSLSSKQNVFQLLILVLLAVFGYPQSVRSQSEGRTRTRPVLVSAASSSSIVLAVTMKERRQPV